MHNAPIPSFRDGSKSQTRNPEIFYVEIPGSLAMLAPRNDSWFQPMSRAA